MYLGVVPVNQVTVKPNLAHLIQSSKPPPQAIEGRIEKVDCEKSGKAIDDGEERGAR
jgi:hypothetical protein